MNDIIIEEPIQDLTFELPKTTIATLHCNDRNAVFEVIDSLYEQTKNIPMWTILSQGCSKTHNDNIRKKLESYGIQYDLIEIEENMGWSRGMNTLYNYLASNDYKFVFHLEDDWICTDIKSKDWLTNCLTYLVLNPNVSTLFLRKYLTEEEKIFYGWKRHINYLCFKYSNPFMYNEKIKTEPKKEFRDITFRRIPEFLYTANPTIFRLSDYLEKNVFPFPEFNDISNLQKEWKTTTNDNAPEWGCSEALSMEKIRDLICMNVDNGYFYHRF